jgi:uncharacterized protein with HEPN domain
VSTRSQRPHRHLQAVLEAAADLVFEVGIPTEPAGMANVDGVHQLAFCECVRRVGESVAQIDALDPDWLSSHLSELPWRDIKATRNRLTTTTGQSTTRSYTRSLSFTCPR